MSAHLVLGIPFTAPMLFDHWEMEEGVEEDNGPTPKAAFLAWCEKVSPGKGALYAAIIYETWQEDWEVLPGQYGIYLLPDGEKQVFGMLLGKTGDDGTVSSFPVTDLADFMAKVSEQVRELGMVSPDDTTPLRLYTILDVA